MRVGGYGPGSVGGSDIDTCKSRSPSVLQEIEKSVPLLLPFHGIRVKGGLQELQ